MPAVEIDALVLGTLVDELVDDDEPAALLRA